MNYIITIAFLILINGVRAQNVTKLSLSGRVVTVDGSPAPGLLVSIQNSNYRAFTDSNGQFVIGSPRASIVLLVKSGVNNNQEEFSLTADANYRLPKVVIKAKSYELNEVVITGQYEPQSLKNAVYRVRTINAKTIENRSALNIQQLLNTEFGFRFNNDLTLGTTDVEMMGMSGRNVKILLDGVPLVDRSDLRESLNQIDVNTVERVEIIEGPMSVVYGTDALAGVINIISKRAGSKNLSITAKIQEETAGNEYKLSNSKGLHNKNVSATWLNGSWYAMAGFSNNVFAGWNVLPKTATSAEVSNNVNFKPKEQYLANAKLGYSKRNFNVWYRLDYLTEDINTRFGINPNYTVVNQVYNTNRINNQAHADWQINSRLALNFSGGYTDLQRKTITKLYDFNTASESLTTGQGEQDLAKFRSAILRSTLQYKISDAIAIQPGFEFNRDAGDGARIKGKPAINDYAVFASAEIKPTDKIKLKPGVRLIKNSVYDAPAAVPSLNVMMNITKSVELRLGYGRGFRAPALRELFFDFVDASHTILGNENLRAEKSNSFDASVACDVFTDTKLKVRSTLSTFYNNFYDRIDYGVSASDPSVTTLINISKYKTAGFAFDNNVRYKQLQANVGASYIGRFNQLTQGNLQNEVPTFSWTPELFANLTYDLEKLKSAVILSLKHTGARPSYQLDNANSTARLVKIGAFTWTDLMINKSINKFLKLNAGVKNVFDVTSLTNSATNTGGAHSAGGGAVAYSYGRSYVLGLTANWSKN